MIKRLLTAALLSTALAGASASATLTPPDGGVGYYGQFSNPLPSTSSYFPIGVWFESVTSQANIDLDKDAGLNLYVVITTNSNLGLIQSNGMNVIIQQDQFSHSGTYNSAVSGWELNDEIDMDQANPEGAAIARDELRAILDSLPADGRARYNNYGKGVMFWNNNSDAKKYFNFVDLISDDAYWFTDENICSQFEGGELINGGTAPLTPAECHRALNYGLAVDRMRFLDNKIDGRQPIWAFVEVGHPFSQSSWPSIQPAEIRAAVWHSIIAGARGIIYFNHSFGGPCPTQHALRESCYAAARAVVKSTNAQIASLATVLNSDTATDFVTANNKVRFMVKQPVGTTDFYIFAARKDNSSANGTFTLPAGPWTTATVVGESRSIPIISSTFSDNFADGNAVHIYQVH